MKKKPRTTKKQRKEQRSNIDAFERMRTMDPREAAELLRASQQEMGMGAQEALGFVRALQAGGLLPPGTSDELPFVESTQHPTLLPFETDGWKVV